MLVSELVERSGVPLATIKYYLREGLLMPGESMSATRARYGDQHLRRLGLIRALVDVAGLPVQKARVVIGLLEHPEGELFETLGKAIAALPPYGDESEGEPDYPRARAALQKLGQVYDPDYAAVGQFERALAAAEAAGLPMSEERLLRYGELIMGLAEYDVTNVPTGSPQVAIEHAVLGTALYEPVITAMRRLAHQDVASRVLPRGE